MNSLNARVRDGQGKGAARRLRREGMIPGVIYGRGETPRSVAVNARELQYLLSHVSVENTIIDLRVGEQGPAQALIREVQYHPARPEVLHVDFFHVHAGEKIRLEIPIRLHGVPEGVRSQGGVLDQVLYSLHVECLPKDIPEAIDVDVERLGAGDSVHVSEVDAQGATILNDPELVVATVAHPTAAALPETPETDVGIGGDVEPELIRGHRADAEDVPFQHGSAQPE